MFKGIGIGAAIGAGYGVLSDDTSLLGGAIKGGMIGGFSKARGGVAGALIGGTYGALSGGSTVLGGAALGSAIGAGWSHFGTPMSKAYSETMSRRAYPARFKTKRAAANAAAWARGKKQYATLLSNMGF